MSDEKIVMDESPAAARCRDRTGGRFARDGQRDAGLGASCQRGRSLHAGRDALVQRLHPGRRPDRRLPEDQATPAEC